MTTMLAQGCEQAIEPLVREGSRRGGNAIAAVRRGSSELASTWTGLCAHGTAAIRTRAVTCLSRLEVAITWAVLG